MDFKGRHQEEMFVFFQASIKGEKVKCHELDIVNVGRQAKRVTLWKTIV